MCAHMCAWRASVVTLLLSLMWRGLLSDTQYNDVVADPGLRLLADDFWQWKLREFPEWATMEGFHGHDDKLESYTTANYRQRWEFIRGLLLRADLTDRAALCKADQLTLDVLRDQLRTYIDGHQYFNYGHLNPINFLEGMHRSLAWTHDAATSTAQDYERYLRRLHLIPKQTEEVKNLMEMAIQLGRTNHNVSMSNVLDDLDALTGSDFRLTPFYEPFYRPMKEIPDEERRNLRSQARAVIIHHVQPAFTRLRHYLSSRYLLATRPHEGVWSLENGTDYYRSVLRWHLSEDVTPQWVHDLGLREVTRIRREMDRVMGFMGFSGELPEFFRFLRKQTKYFDHTKSGFIDLFRDAVYQKIQPRLPQLFMNLSTLPNISIVHMSNDGIDAQYVGNQFVVNTHRAETKPSFSALALSLHEALPGHHLQISLSRALPLPNFRRFLWGGRKYAAPFHFPYYTAYVEGWGLYAEYLGEELGVFDKAHDLFGRYTFEIFRACRLVVDTGIHAFKWSREQAITYMGNLTFLTRKQIETEVDRYITWPGQACAYKIGELKLKELRKRAWRKLKYRFDLRDFHWQVLRIGPVPLHLLEAHIDEWIASRMPSAAPPTSHPCNYFLWVALAVTSLLRL